MLPFLTSKVVFKEKAINSFFGLNRQEALNPGEITEGCNMTSENFPYISARRKRKKLSETKGIINGLSTFEGYIYSSYHPDTGKLFLNFENTDYEFTDYTDSLPELTRKFASLSNSILIIPDNIIFYTNSRTFAKICVSQESSASSAREKFSKESNNSDALGSTIRYIASYTHNSISYRKTSYTSSGAKDFYYSAFDQNLKSGDTVTLKMTVFSETAEEDSTYKTYATKMRNGISVKIKDTVVVTHATAKGDITETVELIFADNTIPTGGYKNLRISKIIVERGMPALENICSHNNRIWATSENEIYASKLGDASEWNDFTTDSYGLMPYACFNTKAETDGTFTGIIPYNNFIFAFKENAIHKIYGNKPDEFTLHTKKCPGLLTGAHSCLCIGANAIIYPSSDGIYTYSDDFPLCISSKLIYDFIPVDACSTNKYYYVLAKENDSKKLFVYDLKRKLWHSQDAPSDSVFVSCYGKNVYLATSTCIIQIDPSSYESSETESVFWNFKMEFDDSTFEKRGYGTISMRYSLEKDASFTVRAIYDDNTKGAVCGSVYDESQTGGYMITIPIKRCRRFILDFSGRGYFMLKGLKLKFYQGSEI